MLILSLIGARRFVKQSGTRPQKQSISSTTSSGISWAGFEFQVVLEMKVKMHSRAEKQGLRNPAAKQAMPAQCCMLACVTRLSDKSAKVVANSLWPLSRAYWTLPKVPSISPPKIGPLKAFTKLFATLSGSPSLCEALTNESWASEFLYSPFPKSLEKFVFRM